MRVLCEDLPLPVAEARSGDSDAWAALLDRYRRPLYAFVQELVRHEQTSLDIVQETFINAARHIRSLREDHKFGSWLFSIAHQKCLQHWRKPNPEQIAIEIPEPSFPDDNPGPVEWLIRKEQEEAFLALLGRLAAPMRAVLLLHFLEDFSLPEIAVITGTPIGTVKSRLHYGRQAMRKLLEDTRT
jgi:RNA polymerase sigma-70 factor (ECF subfamily)